MALPYSRELFGVDPASGALFVTVYDSLSSTVQLLKSTDGGASWTALDSRFTVEAGRVFRKTAHDPQSGATYGLYASGSGIAKSLDGGREWRALTGRFVNLSFLSLAVDPASGSAYFATSSGSLFKSTDGGATLTRVPGSLPSKSQTLALAASRRLMLAGTRTGLFKSLDAGASWTPTGLKKVMKALLIQPRALYAAGSGGVFKSINGGKTWRNVGLPNQTVTTLKLDPRTGALYAGTLASGVFKLPRGATAWIPMNVGLRSKRINDLALDPAKPGTLYAATPTGVYHFREASTR